MRRAPRPAQAPRLAAAAVLLMTLAGAAASVSAGVAPPRAAGPPPASAAAAWAPLRLESGPRAGIRGARGRGPRDPRLLREAGADASGASDAYVVDGGTRLGYYTASLSVGSPPKSFNLILDSGSSLTVVPCKPCQCGYHLSQPFDPAASSTATNLTCSDASCPKEKASCGTKPAGASCQFHNMYAEGSSSGGQVMQDTLLLPRPGNATPEVLPRFTFGCAKFVTGQLYTQKADGVAGLSYGPAALPAQLAAARVGGSSGAAPGSYTLCLGRRGGAMALGQPARPAGAAAVQYVPLVPSGRGFYQLPVHGLLVNGIKLDVPESAWSPPKGVKDDAGVTLHTIIVDSGSTFTYLASDVLKSLKQQLKAALAPLAAPPRAVPDAPRRLGLGRLLLRRLTRGLRQARPRPPEGAAPNAAASDAYSDDDHMMSYFQTSPQQPDAAGPGPRAGSVHVDEISEGRDRGDWCWSLSGPGIDQIKTEYDLGAIFPTLELVFRGGARLSLPPQRYVHVTGRTKGATPRGPRVRACLGIFNGEEESILGAIMMRDATFEFDWAGAKRLGFADADCSQISEGLARSAP